MTTDVSTLPSPWATLEAALRARRPTWVTYHRRRRLICPHALGWKTGRPMVLGYQTGGETTTGTLDPDPSKRWRCMYVDEIDHVAAANPPSPWTTGDNYNPSNPFPAIDELTAAVTATDGLPAT